MNLRTFVIGSASAMLGMCLALAVVGSAFGQRGDPVPASRPTGGESVGRYQLVVGQAMPYMTDTTTGECWHLSGGWQSMGNPRQSEANNRNPDERNRKPSTADRPQ